MREHVTTDGKSDVGWKVGKEEKKVGRRGLLDDEISLGLTRKVR